MWRRHPCQSCTCGGPSTHRGSWAWPFQRHNDLRSNRANESLWLHRVASTSNWSHHPATSRIRVGPHFGDAGCCDRAQDILVCARAPHDLPSWFAGTLAGPLPCCLSIGIMHLSSSLSILRMEPRDPVDPVGTRRRS